MDEEEGTSTSQISKLEDATVASAALFATLQVWSEQGGPVGAIALCGCGGYHADCGVALTDSN